MSAFHPPAELRERARQGLVDFARAVLTERGVVHDTNGARAIDLRYLAEDATAELDPATVRLVHDSDFDCCAAFDECLGGHTAELRAEATTTDGRHVTALLDSDSLDLVDLLARLLPYVEPSPTTDG